MQCQSAWDKNIIKKRRKAGKWTQFKLDCHSKRCKQTPACCPLIYPEQLKAFLKNNIFTVGGKTVTHAWWSWSERLSPPWWRLWSEGCVFQKSSLEETMLWISFSASGLVKALMGCIQRRCSCGKWQWIQLVRNHPSFLSLAPLVSRGSVMSRRATLPHLGQWKHHQPLVSSTFFLVCLSLRFIW